MSRACAKFLHITYLSRNTWGYPLQNAINAAVSRGNAALLTDQLKHEIGDLVIAVSVRLDYLPSIIDRINGSVKLLYEEVKQRDKAADRYAYEPKSDVKFPLLVDINSFLFEIYSGLEVVETLGKKVLRRVLRRRVVENCLVEAVLAAQNAPMEWLKKLEEWRHHFTHSGTPWIAVCLDQEPAYDLLVMKSNVHDFTDAETFFRLSELNEVLRGFMEALRLVQQRIVDVASAQRGAVVQGSLGDGG